MKKLVKTKMAEAVQRAKYVSIATDAWTDVNGQSVVNYIAMKAIYTKDNSHTADDLARTTAAVIEEIRAKKVAVLENAAARISIFKLDMHRLCCSLAKPDGKGHVKT